MSAFALITPSPVFSKSFYVDPANGSMQNDGSASAPWHTLQEVISANLISSYKWSPLPYNPQTSQLVVFNANAPVQAGDTIVLMSGLHGSVFLQNYNNPFPITIMGAEGAQPVLEFIHLQACSNWVIQGLSVSTEPYGYYLDGILVYLESHGWQGPCRHITLSDCTVYSVSSPWTMAQEWVDGASDGIFIKGDSMTVEHNTMMNVAFGITAFGSHLLVKSNRVINFSGDGMRLLGSYNVFEGNMVKNCYDVDDNHDDGLQSWTTNGIVVDHNIVRGNIILNYEDPNQPLLGPLQGIGCFDGFYNDWLVENNLISVNHWHGIAFLGANNVRIINNTVLDPTPDITPGPSWIRIDDHKNGMPSSGCTVKNNVANTFIVDGVQDHNSVLNTYLDYSENFVDYATYDFRLIAGSILIDSADATVAPLTDLLGHSRPQGNGPDIGCYEFETATGTHPIDGYPAAIQPYPNPSTDFFRLNLPNGLFHIVLYDVMGKPELSWDNYLPDQPISVAALLPGTYFLKITGSDGRPFELQKLIRQ